MDKISNIPPQIIETILCLVTIKEAARTSILSKEWRYKWTKIPKLVINEDTFRASDQNSMTQTTFNGIYQLLLNYQGPMQEFSLSIKGLPAVEHRLPLSLLPMHQLKELYLHGCFLPAEPRLVGTSSITRLSLSGVITSTKWLLHLLSSCPVLKSLHLSPLQRQFLGRDELTLINLLKCLLEIENLTISFVGITFSATCGASHKLPTPLVNLKYLCVKYWSFEHLPSLSFVMRSSPTLKILHIQMSNFLRLLYPEVDSFTVESQLDISSNHLKELKISNLSNMKCELDFVKFFLAKSPELEKLTIVLFCELDEDAEFQISRTILSSPRASPGVEITVSLSTIEFH